jgi:hypothetical protein
MAVPFTTYFFRRFPFLGPSTLYLSILTLASCTEQCTGHIESTVLYFQEAPNQQGQLAYVNVINKADMGINQTLTREDKEFGTFNNVVIIVDPQMKFKGRRTICFDDFTKQPTPADIDLREKDIPRISIVK